MTFADKAYKRSFDCSFGQACRSERSKALDLKEQIHSCILLLTYDVGSWNDAVATVVEISPIQTVSSLVFFRELRTLNKHERTAAHGTTLSGEHFVLRIVGLR